MNRRKKVIRLLHEFRCNGVDKDGKPCGLLLAMVDGMAIIKCRKCGKINKIVTESATSADEHL